MSSLVPPAPGGAHHPVTAFDAVGGRRSADVFLQVATQDLVTLSGQADLKGSIMITSTSIILSVSVAAMRYSEARWGLGVLSIFALASLIMAIWAVLPSGSVRNPAPVGEADLNPLFYRHAAQLSADEYLARMANIVQSDARLYEAMVRQIHQLSVHLETKKFTRLRHGYITLVVGFVTASVVQAVAIALS